jgi:hypothetical protein
MRLNLTTFKSAAQRCENCNQPQAKSDSVMATNTPAIRTRFFAGHAPRFSVLKPH